MDIRDIAQTVVGVLLLKPDQILFNTALSNGMLTAGLVNSNQLGTGPIDVLSLVHSLLIVLSLGLFIGVALPACTAIAFFVAIGAGAGLFEAGTLLNVFGGQIAFVSQPFNGASSVLVAYPLVSDFFLLLPVILFAAAILVWHRRKKADRRKRVKEVDSHLRQYCPACGVHIGPGKKKCRSCGLAFSNEETTAHCTSCGRRITANSNYCVYCGAEIAIGRDLSCPSCDEPVANSARYCPNCGTRLPSSQRQDPSYLVR